MAGVHLLPECVVRKSEWVRYTGLQLGGETWSIQCVVSQLAHAVECIHSLWLLLYLVSYYTALVLQLR